MDLQCWAVCRELVIVVVQDHTYYLEAASMPAVIPAY